MEKERHTVKGTEGARVNLRPLLLCALGLVFGVFLYFRITFGGLRPSDFCFLLLFLFAALLPFSPRRTLCVLGAVVVFAAAGFGISHAYMQNYGSTKEEGIYTVTGTVCSFTVQDGYTVSVIEDLFFDGERTGGKLRASVNSEKVRAGDIVTFKAKISTIQLSNRGDRFGEYLIYNDIRYTASDVKYQKIASSPNIFYGINSAFYDRLDRDMGGEQAKLAYALLTGNSNAIDGDLLSVVQSGGIAHIFAVSGLHIGILFGAVMMLLKPLKKFAVLPAVAFALLYAALCGFSVSAVRAVIMCAVLGSYRAIGRKYDFLQSVSLAAIAALLICPADLLSAGFQLSFGACVGLALFAGPIGRLLKKTKMPRFMSGYLAANLSVQLFTFPILMESFGYFSVWGFLLNLIFIPVLPVFFLAVFVFTALAVIIPPAAAVLLFVPKSLLSLFLLFFSPNAFTYVLTGFSLGMGGVVWLIGTVFLSDRIRMKRSARAIAAVVLAVVFSLAVVRENVVFSGGRITVYAGQDGNAALIETNETAVLIIDGEIRTRHCNDFLARNVWGELDGVIVLDAEEISAINHAAFLRTKAVYARDEVVTGLRKTPVVFGERVQIGELVFRFESREKLLLFAEGVAVEFDFTSLQGIGADLFINSSSGGLIFSLDRGIIKAL